jgi:hypothetical protein
MPSVSNNSPIAADGSLQGAGEQGTYVASLKQRFERKRNIMKLLG